MDISADRDAIRNLLQEARRIAVVGSSPNPARDSHAITKYLIDAGYDVIPVNPGQEEILGRKCYPTLSAVPGPVDIVDIFRSPEHVPPIVEEAIAAKAKSVWMQLGVGNAAAAKRAAEAGLKVVVERCIKVDHSALRIPRPNSR